MRRSRFSEEHILEILQQYQAGTSAEDLCVEHQVSASTFYNWRLRYGRTDRVQSKTIFSLQSENNRLKRMIAKMLEENGRLKGYIRIKDTSNRGSASDRGPREGENRAFSISGDPKVRT